MKKRRLAVYAALVIIFAAACVIQIAPSMIVRAVDAQPAAIGTASLSDAGNTVFIRTAKFTIDGEDYYAAGFTVADAAAGSDPASGVNLDTLTPITVEKPLTGTLDKNIYVCQSSPADLYVKNLKLASGRKIYTDGSGLNFLGGSVEADSVETTGFINLASADLTVNSDLTGFSYLILHKSAENNNGKAYFNTPSSLTVNGNVSNSGEYSRAAVSATAGSKVKVTGSISTEHALVFCDSSLEVGGDITIAQNHGGMCLNLNNGSDAVVGGKIKTNDWIHINNNSSLTADSVECTMLAARNNSYFEIENDVTVSQYLDVGAPDPAETCKIGGNLKSTGWYINLTGNSESSLLNLHVGGDIDTTEFFAYNCNLDFDGDLKHDGGVFLFKSSTADIAGNIESTGCFDLDHSTVNVHGNVKDNYLSPIRNSTLVIDGDGTFVWFDPMLSSDVTVKGNLTSSASFLMANTNATLKVLKDITCNEFCVHNGGKIETGGDLNATYANINTNSELTVGGDLNIGGNYAPLDVMHGGKCTVNGKVTLGTVGVYDNSTLDVLGDVNASSWITSEGEGAMTVGGDLSYNYQSGRIVGAVTVGGDFINNASRESVFNDAGLYVPGKLTVGGDVNMNDLILNCNNEDENLSVDGSINAYRKADIIKTVDGEYVLDGVNVTEKHPSDDSYFYTVPYYAQTAGLTIDGENYIINVRNHDKKNFEPIKAGEPYTVSYELNGGEFKEGAPVEYSYYTVAGIELPGENVFKRNGFLFEAWYDNADFEGSPITEIPEGSTGDKTVYAKMNECDHAGSTAQSDCENSAVCTVCGAEIPAKGHTWNEPVWNWNDIEHPAYSTTCSVCEDAEASGEADSVDAVETAATVDADGFTTYTATVTLGSQVFTNDFVVTDEGSMLEARKAAFGEYKDDVTANIDALAQDSDSEQCKALIDSAKDAVDGVEYDESKSLDENKAAVDAAADLDALEAALEEHRKEYIATFTADGKTVKEIKFTIDTESIESEIPGVPEKTGYTGEWEYYTLTDSDIEITAIYTAIEYTATFIDEKGETLKEVKFTVETETLDEPAVPEKTNYNGEWEEYTIEAKDLTIKPVYTLAGETKVTADCESELTLGYKESKRFAFEPEYMPEGATAHVFYNGEDRGEGTSIEVKEPTDDYTVECKVLDADGNEITTSGEIKIKVKNSFFDKIKWFINNFWVIILKTFIDAIIAAC